MYKKMGWLYWGIAIICVLYFLICLIIYTSQERLMFFPEVVSDDYKFTFSKPFEEVFLVDESPKSRLHALWFKDTQKLKERVVLYLHGNGGSAVGWGHVADDFVPLGYDVLVLDYRGYGKSRGTLSQKGLYEDATIAFNFLKKYYDESKITIFGRSIGTGIATYTASISKPERLILETPYYNFISLVKSHINFLPVSMLLRYRFATNEYISKVSCPIYILHGTKDSTIPYEQGKRLAAKIPEKNFITIEGGNHNNLPEFPLYQKRLRQIMQY